MEKKDIEIPFGAFDSELCGFEYTIPEGYEAEIKNGKVVVKKIESEDEKIRKGLIEVFKSIKSPIWFGLNIVDIIAWLEKQRKPTDIPGDAILDGNEDGLIADTIRCKKEKQGEQKYSPLCNTVKDKIREYIANHFITDTVVRTDVSSIVHAMEEGVRLGKEEQKPAEWSEKDESHLCGLIGLLEDVSKDKRRDFRIISDNEKDDIEHWLKSLKERIQPQPKQEWSEEDEYLLDETIKHLESLIRIIEKQGSAYSDEIQYYQRDIDWLKSLRPQSTWKPSDKQMKALGVATNISNVPEKEYLELEKLYQDLKKLREE